MKKPIKLVEKMNYRRLFGVVLSAALLALGSDAFGSANYPGLMDAAIKAKYVNFGNAGYGGDCTTCHGNIPQLNQGFGQDFDNNGGGPNLNQAQVELILNDIAMLDSDNDGSVNELEFQGGTDPGDPNSKPSGNGAPPPQNPQNPLPESGQSGGDSGSRELASSNSQVVGGCGSAFQASSDASSVSFMWFFLLLPVTVLTWLRWKNSR